MNRFYNWLVVSSADPAQFSLTFKGILLQYAAILLLALQLIHFPYTQNQVYDFMGVVSSIAGTLMGIFGLCRKLYFEVKASLSK